MSLEARKVGNFQFYPIENASSATSDEMLEMDLAFIFDPLIQKVISRPYRGYCKIGSVGQFIYTVNGMTEFGVNFVKILCNSACGKVNKTRDYRDVLVNDKEPMIRVYNNNRNPMIHPEFDFNRYFYLHTTFSTHTWIKKTKEIIERYKLPKYDTWVRNHFYVQMFISLLIQEMIEKNIVKYPSSIVLI